MSVEKSAKKTTKTTKKMQAQINRRTGNELKCQLFIKLAPKKKKKKEEEMALGVERKNLCLRQIKVNAKKGKKCVAPRAFLIICSSFLLLLFVLLLLPAIVIGNAERPTAAANNNKENEETTTTTTSGNDVSRSREKKCRPLPVDNNHARATQFKGKKS